MVDIRALTADAACTWDYIDRLRMAVATACKERDEQIASNRQVTETLRRNGFGSLEELLASNKQVKAERNAAVEDLLRICKNPAQIDRMIAQKRWSGTKEVR